MHRRICQQLRLKHTKKKKTKNALELKTWTCIQTHTKMGPTVLFTHLKIILLPCFQFLVSTKEVLSKRTLSTRLGAQMILRDVVSEYSNAILMCYIGRNFVSSTIFHLSVYTRKKKIIFLLT